jgi:hypothetical protein
MCDGVVLLVDSVEGPMPQTRFVTKKALLLNKKVRAPRLEVARGGGCGRARPLMAEVAAVAAAAAAAAAAAHGPQRRRQRPEPTGVLGSPPTPPQTAPPPLLLAP